MYSKFDLAISLTGHDGTQLADDDLRYGRINARYV